MAYEVKFVGYDISGGHCEYNIHVIGQPEEGSWQIRRRYNSMRTLNEALRNIAGNRMPVFPPKKLFGNLKVSFIEQRRGQLEQYFKELQAIPQVVNSKEYKDYLCPSDKTYIQRPKPTNIPRNNSPVQQLRAQSDFHEDLHARYNTIAEEINGKFIDLANQANPLEDEDVARKQQEYQGQISSIKVHAFRGLPASESENRKQGLSQAIAQAERFADELEATLADMALNPIPFIRELNIANG